MRQKHEYYVDCDKLSSTLAGEIANWTYERTCRLDFDQPGFVLINLPAVQGSHQLRRVMVDLKRILDAIHQARTGKRLAYLSMGRFDQQVTTKPHRDGGPDESVLMLGYEPTSVRSRLRMADYSKCAFDLGFKPAELLRKHNPMYADGEQMLADYTTQLEGVDPTCFQILVINNSCVPFRQNNQGLLGVLHEAIIENPNASATRIVNSTMIASVAVDAGEAITEEMQEQFLTTDEISKSVYDD